MTRDWRNDAACKGLAPQFDAKIAGEHYAAQKTRHETAKRICATCPVIAECKADFNPLYDAGVRFGKVYGVDKSNVPAGGGRGHVERKPVGKEKPITHGTTGGYRAHLRRQERSCEACHNAEKRYRKDRALAKKRAAA